MSQQNTLPEPALDLSRLPPSASTFVPNNYRQNSGPIRAPVPTYATDDPWNTNSRVATAPSIGFEVAQENPVIGAPSSLAGTGLPPNWWKKQDTVNVSILGQQGFILNRYMVYEVSAVSSFPVISFRLLIIWLARHPGPQKIFRVRFCVGVSLASISVSAVPSLAAQTHRRYVSIRISQPKLISD